MHEFVTDAIVVRTAPRGGYDRAVSLYTRRLGRVEAIAVGALRPASKFAPHLDLLNLVRVRLVEKNRFTVTDALTKERFAALRVDRARHAPALAFASLLHALAPLREPDPRVWSASLRALGGGNASLGPLLTLFGYEGTHARCALCGAAHPGYFSARDHSFYCAACGSQFPKGEVLYTYAV